LGFLVRVFFFGFLVTWIFLRFCAFQTLPLAVTRNSASGCFLVRVDARNSASHRCLSVDWAFVAAASFGQKSEVFFCGVWNSLGLETLPLTVTRNSPSSLFLERYNKHSEIACWLLLALLWPRLHLGRSVFLASETPWLSDSAFFVASETPLLGLKIRWNKFYWDQVISSTEIKMDGDFFFLWNQEVLWSSTMVSTSFFTLALSVSLEGWSTRPKPSPYTSKHQFNLHEEVDAYEIDGWWVRKVLDNHDKLLPHSNS
jgi:hypothetical protein